MILIDTGYLPALLDTRDALHVRATAWASKPTERMLVSEYVPVETFNACSRPINRPKVHALLAHLRASGEYEIVPASADLFEAGTRLHRQRPDKGVVINRLHFLPSYAVSNPRACVVARGSIDIDMSIEPVSPLYFSTSETACRQMYGQKGQSNHGTELQPTCRYAERNF